MDKNKQIKQRPRYGIDGFIVHQPIKRQPLIQDRSSGLGNHQVSASRVSSNYYGSSQSAKPIASSVQLTDPPLNNTNQVVGSQHITLDLPHDNTKRSRKKSTKKRLLLRSTIVILGVFFGFGSFLGVKALNTVDKVFHGNVISDATAAFNDSPLKGEDSGRVNILLAGDSKDDPGHGGGNLTDSILVLSIDTKSRTAFLLSIPRDLWVNIPGYGWQKINSANNNLGTNFAGYPQNGMGQLEHIVTADLGIPIDYYALSDYGAFKDAVNAVGGVSVNIQSPDPRGLYDAYTNLKLPNGEVFLNGQEALNLARARGDGNAGDISYGFPQTDFGRTDHQRQLFTAITEKAKSLGFLANPIKISDLMNAFSNNVETDLSLQNILRLVQITKGINLSGVQSYAYCATLTPGCSPYLLTGYTDPSSGQEALIPTDGIGNYGQMGQYYQQLSSSNPVVKEGANVVILNASDSNGLAKLQKTLLQSKGINVATIANSNSLHPTTMIVDNSKGVKPNSLKLLQKLYPGTTVTSDTGSSEATEAQGYSADFIVILGQNWDIASTNTP